MIREPLEMAVVCIVPKVTSVCGEEERPLGNSRATGHDIRHTVLQRHILQSVCEMVGGP